MTRTAGIVGTAPQHVVPTPAAGAPVRSDVRLRDLEQQLKALPFTPASSAVRQQLEAELATLRHGAPSRTATAAEFGRAFSSAARLKFVNDAIGAALGAGPVEAQLARAHTGLGDVPAGQKLQSELAGAQAEARSAKTALEALLPVAQRAAAAAKAFEKQNPGRVYPGALEAVVTLPEVLQRQLAAGDLAAAGKQVLEVKGWVAKHLAPGSQDPAMRALHEASVPPVMQAARAESLRSMAAALTRAESAPVGSTYDAMTQYQAALDAARTAVDEAVTQSAKPFGKGLDAALVALEAVDLARARLGEVSKAALQKAGAGHATGATLATLRDLGLTLEAARKTRALVPERAAAEVLQRAKAAKDLLGALVSA